MRHTNHHVMYFRLTWGRSKVSCAHHFLSLSFVIGRKTVLGAEYPTKTPETCSMRHDIMLHGSRSERKLQYEERGDVIYEFSCLSNITKLSLRNLLAYKLFLIYSTLTQSIVQFSAVAQLAAAKQRHTWCHHYQTEPHWGQIIVHAAITHIVRLSCSTHSSLVGSGNVTVLPNKERARCGGWSSVKIISNISISAKHSVQTQLTFCAWNFIICKVQDVQQLPRELQQIVKAIKPEIDKILSQEHNLPFTKQHYTLKTANNNNRQLPPTSYVSLFRSRSANANRSCCNLLKYESTNSFVFASSAWLLADTRACGSLSSTSGTILGRLRPLEWVPSSRFHAM